MSMSKPDCAPDVDRGAGDRSIGQRARHRGGDLVELRLRLDQHLVAHLEIGGDLARADRLAGDQVDVAAVRRPRA